MDPNESVNYFALSRIYEDSGDYENAEATLVKAREMKPTDPAVYTTLAAYYNRQGEFDKSMEALVARADREPNNPEAFYTIATYYWEKAYRDFNLSDAEKMKYVQLGLEAVDKAIEPQRPATWKPWSTRTCSFASRPTSNRTLPDSRRCSRKRRTCSNRAEDIKKKNAAGAVEAAAAATPGRTD